MCRRDRSSELPTVVSCRERRVGSRKHFRSSGPTVQVPTTASGGTKVTRHPSSYQVSNVFRTYRTKTENEDSGSLPFTDRVPVCLGPVLLTAP